MHRASPVCHCVIGPVNWLGFGPLAPFLLLASPALATSRRKGVADAARYQMLNAQGVA
jgi:hypothetical protein